MCEKTLSCALTLCAPSCLQNEWESGTVLSAWLLGRLRGRGDLEDQQVLRLRLMPLESHLSSPKLLPSILCLAPPTGSWAAVTGPVGQVATAGKGVGRPGGPQPRGSSATDLGKAGMRPGPLGSPSPHRAPPLPHSPCPTLWGRGTFRQGPGSTFSLPLAPTPTLLPSTLGCPIRPTPGCQFYE